MDAENEMIVVTPKDIIAKDKEDNKFKSTLTKLLNLPMTNDLLKKYDESGIKLNKGNLHDAVAASMILGALTGNVPAYIAIRDTMGYKPVDKVSSDVVVRIDMSPKAKELGE